MNTNIKTIIIAIISAAIGLGAGYLFFNKNSQTAISNEHTGHAHHNSDATAVEDENTIFTCSMHPQIRQNEMGICPICEMDLIPLEANTSNDPLVLEMTEEAVKLSNIQTTVVGQSKSGKTEQATITLSGKIQADETRTNSIVTHIPGRVEKLYVGFVGEYVQKGQAIARIYSPDLILVQREIKEARKMQDLSPNLLEAAINKLKYWKLSDKTVEQILASETILESVDIYAHHSGVVTQKRVKVGDHLMLGMALFDIQNLYKVWASFDAYEKDLAHISIGDKIEFTTPALPHKTFKGRINFIDPVINPQTRVATIRTEITNKNGLLKPEMFINGMLTIKSQKNTSSSAKNMAISVPKSAVMWTGKRSVVYVKVPNTTIPSYQYREVEIGDGMGSSYAVISGLEAGEEVVTYGSFTIDAAAQLNNQQSMMNKKVNIKAAGDEPLPDFTAETPDEFKSHINDLANSYILLKDALVATDASAAPTAAQDFLKELKKVDMSLLKGDAHMYWMEQLEAMDAHAKKITALTDVEAQRKQFGFLSDALILAIQVFGTKGKALYVQHCPMAFDNQGADWLSLEEGIRNPYFGDKMMKCGLVKKAL